MYIPALGLPEGSPLGLCDSSNYGYSTADFKFGILPACAGRPNREYPELETRLRNLISGYIRNTIVT